MSYGAVHRYFLRTVASLGVLNYSNAQTILDESFPDRENISIEDLTNEINDKIKPFQQKIKIVNDEVTLEKIVVFLSFAYDNATKSQNVFSAKELDFFRDLIEHIMIMESRQITSQYALKLANNLELSKTEAQKLLNTWCRMYYLEDTNSNYALGTRAIHEFEQYLLDYMPDTIENCCLCRHIVFRGYNCPPCGEAVHLRCLSEYVKTVNKWPCCKADFDDSQLEMLNSVGSSQPLEESPRITQRSAQSLSSSNETNESYDDEFEQT